MPVPVTPPPPGMICEVRENSTGYHAFQSGQTVRVLPDPPRENHTYGTVVYCTDDVGLEQWVQVTDLSWPGQPTTDRPIEAGDRVRVIGQYRDVGDSPRHYLEIGSTGAVEYLNRPGGDRTHMVAYLVDVHRPDGTYNEVHDTQIVAVHLLEHADRPTRRPPRRISVTTGARTRPAPTIHRDPFAEPLPPDLSTALLEHMLRSPDDGVRSMAARRLAGDDPAPFTLTEVAAVALKSATQDTAASDRLVESLSRHVHLTRFGSWVVNHPDIPANPTCPGCSTSVNPGVCSDCISDLRNHRLSR